MRQSTMDGMARKTDPATSHAAAREHHDTGRRDAHQVAAIELMRRHPGCTYRELWQKHCADSRRRGEQMTFAEPVSLMRRLSEVGTKIGKKRCAVTDRTASTWGPK